LGSAHHVGLNFAYSSDAPIAGRAQGIYRYFA
jgi:hypothetical protein